MPTECTSTHIQTVGSNSCIVHLPAQCAVQYYFYDAQVPKEIWKAQEHELLSERNINLDENQARDSVQLGIL